MGQIAPPPPHKKKGWFLTLDEFTSPTMEIKKMQKAWAKA